MAFIVGGLIAAGGAIAGAAISSSGAKKAAKTAAAGSAAEIEFNRESRDIAREDQAPYREAGYTALDALMSLTGLKGSGGGATATSRQGGRFPGIAGEVDNVGTRHVGGGNSRRSSYKAQDYPRIMHNYDGGPTQKGTMYNVAEIEPENVYSMGRVKRVRSPATIDGQTGYVEPGIKGRAEGGFVTRNEIFDKVGGPDNMSPHMGYSPAIMGTNPNTYQSTANTANSTAVNPTTGYPNENPGGVEGGYNFQTDPGYQFRFSEGMRALDRGAAARGGLLSGGYARKAMRYGQDYASGEYTNVYNRIANIAGLGQTSAQNSGQAALYAGANMGTAAAQGGYARASGYQAAGNAWANAANQIAQLPWDKIGSP